MSLKVKQEAIYKSKDWWQWAVWLDGSPKELDRVSHVVYTLHPTFPNPVRAIRNRKEHFRLESAGWGEFEIYLDVAYKDGRTKRRKHWLRLEPPKPAKLTGKLHGAGEQVKAVKTPVIYLSYSVGDTNSAGLLRRILNKNGFIVVPPEEMPAGIPWEKTISKTAGEADMAIFVISGRPSLWMTHEIDMVRTNKVRLVLPILIGADAELPPTLREFQAMKVNDITELEAVGQRIVDKLATQKA